MACIDGSPVFTLDVSSWYLSDAGAPGYHDGLSPCHLSSLMAITLSHGTNEIPFTHVNGVLPLASSCSSPSSKTHSTRNQFMSAGDNLADPSSSIPTLTVPGQRSQMFHRSVSIADLQAGKRMQSLEPDRVCLRRIPQSSHDLRTSAQNQDTVTRNGEFCQTYHSHESYSQHLLPVPRCQTRDEEKRLRRKVQYKSYQDLHILSMYQENGSLLSLNSIRQPQSAAIESSSEASNSTESSPQSSPRPRTPTTMHWPDQLPWCQKTKADDDKLRRINARQVHVIEQKNELDESENEVMQATVLIGPGRPRLIQIHRPQRSGHFSKRQQQQQYCSNRQNGFEPITPAATRDKKQSLSSPYHTPSSSKTWFSRTSPTSRPDTPTPMSQHCPELSVTTCLAMDSFNTSSSRRRLSTSSSDTVFSVDDHKPSCLASPPRNHARRGSSSFSCSTSILDESSPKPTHPSPRSTQTKLGSERSTLDRSCYQRENCQLEHYQLLNSIITSTNKALDALAVREFDLISPILQSFRPNTMTLKSYNTTDHALVAHLYKIFPQKPLSSLSTLAAWLIVDAYYVHLFTTAPPGFTSFDSNSEHCNYTHSHGYSHSPSSSSSPSPPLKPSQLPRITISAATSPNPSSRPRSRTTISTPIHTSNIPSKAKSILGIPNAQPTQIHTDPARCVPHPFDTPPSTTRPSTKSSPLSPARMDEKARIVHASVQTVGRKLVGDLLMSVEKRSRVKGMLGKGSPTGRGEIGAVGGGECSSAHERAVSALWEACRCVTSAEVFVS